MKIDSNKFTLMKQKIKHMKNKLIFLFIGFFFISNFSSSQTIDVVESTLKIGALGEEVFYYGFAERDKIIFNFEVLKGKELKEIEIIELPSSTKFSDYNAVAINDKVLTVQKTGIYKFRFSNSGVTGRICNYRIQRIPSSEASINFNTSVYWKTIYDTTYYKVNENYLISKDTMVHNITDQIAKVHSATNSNGNKSSFNFTLPANTVSWSYYIGVDQAGQNAFNEASKELSQKASPYISSIPGYGPLAALALGSTSYIAQLQSGEDIDYYICDGNNVNLFLVGQVFYYIKKGKVLNESARMTTNLKGSYHFCLSNDNAITGVTVVVKVTAISVTENWGTRSVEKMKITSWKMPYLKN